MRKNKQGGFTLIEMLIVVAIIAILVAVSIPIVGQALERARVATDAANERAAKAELVICYLNETLSDSTTSFATKNVYAYDAANGKIVSNAGTITTPYGKCKTKGHAGAILFGGVGDDGNVYLGWGASSSAPEFDNLAINYGATLHNAVVD